MIRDLYYYIATSDNTFSEPKSESQLTESSDRRRVLQPLWRHIER